LLRQAQPHILHSHSGRAQNLAYLASLGLDIRRVATRHVAFAPSIPLIHKLKYSSTCDGIIAVSETVRGVLLKSGVPASHIEVIHTGVETPPLQDRDAARAKLQLTADNFAI